MVHRPRYWLAWQALTTIADLMFNSNMLYRYYAYNAYNYIFYDYAMVQAGVLGDLSPEDQEIVYKDGTFGMNTIGKLIFWVAAN
jgi:hypothetical protein